jgi:hypothetical protein
MCAFSFCLTLVEKTESTKKIFFYDMQFSYYKIQGGTIDITVHEADNDDNIKEIHAASGDGWGGTIVDKEFERLLVTLVSRDVYEEFKPEHTDDWLDIWHVFRDFEVKKRKITTSSDSPLRMKLPPSLTHFFPCQ